MDSAESQQKVSRRVPGRPFTGADDPRRGRGPKPGTKHRPPEERALRDARVIARQLFDQNARGITQKIVDGALAGDIDCLKLAAARIVPPATAGEPVQGMELLKHPDAAIASQAVVDAVADGRLAPERAELLMNLLAKRAELGLSTVIGERVTQLNALLAQGGLPQLQQTDAVTHIDGDALLEILG
jgi:hypothetical protein